MLRFVDLDERVTISAQMDEDKNDPVIVINKFNVKAEHIGSFLKEWTTYAGIMKRQPGFISAQLHRRIAGSCVIINYVVWESPKHIEWARRD